MFMFLLWILIIIVIAVDKNCYNSYYNYIMHQQFTMMHSQTGGNNKGEWGKCIYTTGYENEGKIIIV